MAGYKGGGKKGKAVDVIPVQMGHENMKGHGRFDTASHDIVPKIPQPAAGIAKDKFGAPSYFHAGGIAAVTGFIIEGERIVDKVLDIRFIPQIVSDRLLQCQFYFCPDIFGSNTIGQ